MYNLSRYTFKQPFMEYDSKSFVMIPLQCATVPFIWTGNDTGNEFFQSKTYEIALTSSQEGVSRAVLNAAARV